MKNEQTFKGYLEYSLLEYPTLYKTPEDVLHHIFMVNGSGLDWVDGKLVNSCNPKTSFSREETYKRNLEELEEKVKEYESELEKVPEVLKGLYYRYLIDALREVNTYQINCKYLDGILDNLEIQEDKLKKIKWYPPNNYSTICNIPENITDGYLGIVSEYVKACLGVIHSINYYHESHENLKWTPWLKKICIKLNKIRKARKLQPIRYKNYRLSGKIKRLPNVRSVEGVPEIGDLVEVTKFGKPEICVVQSWMRVYVTPIKKRKSAKDKILNKLTAELNAENKSANEEKMQWCLPKEATHVSLGSFYAEIEDCKVTGKVDWSIELLHDRRQSAVRLGVNKEILL